MPVALLLVACSGSLDQPASGLPACTVFVPSFGVCVVNDMDLARVVLPNPHVRWAAPTAGALAAALSEAVSVTDVGERAVAAAASVVGRSWEPTKEAVVRIIEEEVYGT